VLSGALSPMQCVRVQKKSVSSRNGNNALVGMRFMGLCRKEPLFRRRGVSHVARRNYPNDSFICQCDAHLHVGSLIAVRKSPELPPRVAMPVEVVVIRPRRPMPVGSTESDSRSEDFVEQEGDRVENSRARAAPVGEAPGHECGRSPTTSRDRLQLRARICALSASHEIQDLRRP